MKFVLKDIKKECEPMIEEQGYDLVDLEYIRDGGSNFLRFYIGKRGGVSIDDCQKVSELVSNKLDELDPIDDSYYLEVSSPGLDRPLKTDKDLDRNIGYDIELNFYQAIDGVKKQVGKLVSYDDDSIVIEDLDDKEITFDRKDISVIKVAINI